MKSVSAGYTLLEMVVVLSILAMATAIAAPMGSRMIATWRNATQVQDVIGQIEYLPSTVRSSGNPLLAGPDDSSHLPIKLPDGWTLQLHEPLKILVNGDCSSATATLTTTTQQIDLQVEAPFCHVKRDSS
ncbi:MAG: prepilin-type N-terminal cleavage/methylation domain-containing protein [Rhodanobacter sp.]